MTKMDQRIAKVEQELTYVFKNKSRVASALYMAADQTLLEVKGKVRPIENNGRLAVVGNSALHLVLAEMWYTNPDQFGGPTREWDDIRTKLLSDTALAVLGDVIWIDPLIVSNTLSDDNTVATTFKALIGAVFLDGGLEEVRLVLEHILA